MYTCGFERRRDRGTGKIDRTNSQKKGCAIGVVEKDKEGKRERERVEVKADGRTDGRRIPDKWIKRKLLNSV